MGLGKIRKLRRALRGGLLRIIGRKIGKADGRLQRVRGFIFKLKLTQINRIALGTNVVATQVSTIAGSNPISLVAGGLSSTAGSFADTAARANGFVSSLDQRLFALGRNLYKRCYRILKLCSIVLGTISKYARRLRRIVRIIKLALKIVKFILKFIGAGAGTKLIIKAQDFLNKLDNALLIVGRSTGQLAAICRDLFDQLSSLKEKYQIEPEDLVDLDGDTKIPCLPGRFDYDIDFCDPDWDDDIDNRETIDTELATLDSELTVIELEVNTLFDRRVPQTKNECLRFLADLDCIDRLDAIVGGLNDISVNDDYAGSIIDRAKGNIQSARDRIDSAVGILDFEDTTTPDIVTNTSDIQVYNNLNVPIVDTLNSSKSDENKIKKDANDTLDSISKNDGSGVEYDNNNIPEYLDYRTSIDDGNLEKLTGPDYSSRYLQGVTLRQAVENPSVEMYKEINDRILRTNTGTELKNNTI